MMFTLLLLAAVPQEPAAVCAARPAEVLVGERYRRHVPSRAKRLSGARTVRVVHPGEMTTMDFREDRLTIRVDHRRVITAVRCG
ncbi:I78 family peptidase inhibitor [Sphingomonas sp.]|uniref:I78 family peptidase inhibitor n=1 Tax=Sphingomonas sp. TaxID=28214 RepID=UPI003B00EF87